MGSTFDYVVFSSKFLINIKSIVPTRIIGTVMYLLFDVWLSNKIFIVLTIFMIFHDIFTFYVSLVTVRDTD